MRFTAAEILGKKEVGDQNSPQKELAEKLAAFAALLSPFAASVSAQQGNGVNATSFSAPEQITSFWSTSNRFMFQNGFPIKPEQKNEIAQLLKDHPDWTVVLATHATESKFNDLKSQVSTTLYNSAKFKQSVDGQSNLRTNRVIVISLGQKNHIQLQVSEKDKKLSGITQNEIEGSLIKGAQQNAPRFDDMVRATISSVEGRAMIRSQSTVPTTTRRDQQTETRPEPRVPTNSGPGMDPWDAALTVMVFVAMAAVAGGAGFLVYRGYQNRQERNRTESKAEKMYADLKEEADVKSTALFQMEDGLKLLANQDNFETVCAGKSLDTMREVFDEINELYTLHRARMSVLDQVAPMLKASDETKEYQQAIDLMTVTSIDTNEVKDLDTYKEETPAFFETLKAKTGKIRKVEITLPEINDEYSERVANVERLYGTMRAATDALASEYTNNTTTVRAEEVFKKLAATISLPDEAVQESISSITLQLKTIEKDGLRDPISENEKLITLKAELELFEEITTKFKDYSNKKSSIEEEVNSFKERLTSALSIEQSDVIDAKTVGVDDLVKRAQVEFENAQEAIRGKLESQVAERTAEYLNIALDKLKNAEVRLERGTKLLSDFPGKAVEAREELAKLESQVSSSQGLYSGLTSTYSSHSIMTSGGGADLASTLKSASADLDRIKNLVTKAEADYAKAELFIAESGLKNGQTESATLQELLATPQKIKTALERLVADASEKWSKLGGAVQGLQNEIGKPYSTDSITTAINSLAAEISRYETSSKNELVDPVSQQASITKFAGRASTLASQLEDNQGKYDNAVNDLQSIDNLITNSKNQAQTLELKGHDDRARTVLGQVEDLEDNRRRSVDSSGNLLAGVFLGTAITALLAAANQVSDQADQYVSDLEEQEREERRQQEAAANQNGFGGGGDFGGGGAGGDWSAGTSTEEVAESGTADFNTSDDSAEHAESGGGTF